MKISNLFKKLFFKRSKYIPYSRQKVTWIDILAVVKVLKSDFLTQGKLIEKFEKNLTEISNAEYAVGVNSATSALHISCLALGLSEKDYLWTSPITFVASANCARYCGAKIDFVDIEPETGLMSINSLREKLETAKLVNKLPKVVIPVHFAGSSCDMKEISKLSKIYGFSIIEDASHALGGKYNSKPVGSCEYSDITVFSFHPVKIITTGEGGAAITNNKVYAQKMKDLRSHCIIKNKNRFEDNITYEWKYEMQGLGFNYRMNEIQAALGISQLKRLKKIVSKRNKIFKTYTELLVDMPVNLLMVPKNTYSSFHLAIVRLEEKSKHNYIFNGMRGSSIGVQLHYYPVHLQPYYKKLGFKKGDFPKAEEFYSKIFSLPIYPELTNSDLLRITKTLSYLLQNKEN